MMMMMMLMTSMWQRAAAAAAAAGRWVAPSLGLDWKQSLTGQASTSAIGRNTVNVPAWFLQQYPTGSVASTNHHA